jgi:hypothetical protein
MVGWAGHVTAFKEQLSKIGVTSGTAWDTYGYPDEVSAYDFY